MISILSVLQQQQHPLMALCLGLSGTRNV